MYSFGEESEAYKKRELFFFCICNVMPMNFFFDCCLFVCLFFVGCNVSCNRQCFGFRDFNETKIFPENFYFGGNVYELCFHAIRTPNFGSENNSVLQFDKNILSETCVKRL